MKLDPKCTRDILSLFESIVTDANVTYFIDSWKELQESPSLQKYSVNKIAYHCQQLNLSGCLYNAVLYPQGGLSFMDLTPAGHDLLAHLRIPKIFSILEKTISLMGSSSILQMASIASEAYTSILPELVSSVSESLRKSQE